ncbi:hypothetical protein ACHAWO_010258 [Cyclotella atomus]|jgi:hypothetical protein|uniref:Uncharacterized protein n=1 Tax=Cyclotella atomus TaxID=382360 RepID=A0ABD3NZ22_9STRA
MPSKIRSLFKRKDNASETNSKASERSYTPPLNDASTTSSDQPAQTDAPPQNPQPILRNQSSTLLSKRFGKNCSIKSRDGVPIITSSGADDFSPSLVQGNTVAQGNKKKEKRTKTRPSAKSSAFSGAPRYDWMDIETAAAIKVQSVYRRNKVLKYLEENNMSTPGMRNRRRRRMAKMSKVQSEDVPFPFNMCGVGFLFGDGTPEDEKYTSSLEKKKKDKMKEEMEKNEASKRKFRMRKKGSQHLEEGIEVVESFDEQDRDE